MRVVIAEDAVLLREGLARLLEEAASRSSRASATARRCVDAIVEHRPDVAIVDVRMPPTFPDEGVRAALGRREPARTPVLILSQYVEERYAGELLAGDERGIGYLLKDRVADVADFVDGGAPGRRRRHRARPGGRRAAARPAARPRPAAELTAARARGAGADGRGPHQQRDRATAGRHATARSRSTSSIFLKLGLPPRTATTAACWQSQSGRLAVIALL